MGRSGSHRAPVVLKAIGLVVTVAALSCTPLRRHAILDLVFDGVPPYVEPQERARRAAAAAALEAEAAAARSRSSRHAPVEKLARFTHGPYAAKECTRCHDLGAASGFRGARRTEAIAPAAREALAQGGRLRMPLVQLCTYCHTEFDPDDPVNSGLWLHGPVATGWCITCHQAHSSYYPYLLLAQPTARLCSQCHEPEALVAYVSEHRPLDPQDAYPQLPETSNDLAGAVGERPIVQVVANCTRCHDPHRGRDRFLLKEELETELGSDHRVVRATTGP